MSNTYYVKAKEERIKVQLNYSPGPDSWTRVSQANTTKKTNCVSNYLTKL